MSFDLGSAHGRVEIAADLKGLAAARKGLQDFQKQSDTTSAAVKRNFDDVGRSMTALGQKMSAAVTLPFVAGVGLAVKAASDLNEQITATQTIFGTAGDQVVRFSQTAAQALGFSQRAALEAAVGFAGMGAAAGLTTTELADFSEQLVVNAADLASFFNQDPSEMLNRLRSGLAGEAEPLRRFGIDLTEANVLLKAMELGLGDTADELTQQEKVLARYAVIQAELGSAEGDRVRTAGQLAGSMRTLRAEFEDAAATLGRELLPAMTAAVHVFTDLVRTFAGLPPEVQKGVLALGAMAAVLGPLLLVAGAVASAITALTASSALATVATAALAAVLSPLALLLAGGVGIGLIAKQIIETKGAAEEARDPIDSLAQSIVDLGDAAETATAKRSAEQLAAAWQITADNAKAAADAGAQARAQFADPGTAFGAGATEASAAEAIEENAAALAKQREEAEKTALTNEQLASAERSLATIQRSTAEDRNQLMLQATHILEDYNAGFLGPDGLVTQLGNVASASQGARVGISDVAASTQGAADATEDWTIWQRIAAQRATEPWNDASGAVLGLNENIGTTTETALHAEAQARQTADAFFDMARAASADVAFQASPAAELVGFGEQTPAEAQANADALARVSEQRTQEIAANAERRRELEHNTAREIEDINRALVQTLQGFDQQRAQNARQMQASIVDLERQTAQQVAAIEQQRASAIAQANDQLAGIAEQRADVEQNLQEGIADAQEAAAEQFADIAERRVEITEDAAERMVDAEKAAAERIAAIAEQRREVEEQLAESLADSREQAAEALSDLAERQTEIQTQLRESLASAQEQYNETLKDLAEAQAEVRQNLGEQLKDLAEAWREQERDLDAARAEIRADLRASLREMDAEWNRINQNNLRQQQVLRGEMQDTLKQNALTAQQLRDDLARMQGDPTFTEDEKADAAFRTARALEGLALDRQLAERDAARTIADLEAERRDQQKEYEAERQTAVEQAMRDLRDLNRQRMEAEQAYHDRRIELEADAQEQLAEFNERRREAASQLNEAELDAREQAADSMRDLEEQRADLVEDQAEREAELRENAAEQMVNLAQQQTQLEQDLAEQRRDIREQTTEQIADLAAQEAEIAQDLAKTEQDLREQAAEQQAELADREAEIRADLNSRLAALEAEKAIVYRDAARERETIEREFAANAEQIARDRMQAEKQAVQDGLIAERELRRTLAEEDLAIAEEQGRAVGTAQGDGIVAGLASAEPEVEAAGLLVGEAAVRGVVNAEGSMRAIGVNMGNALAGGLLAAAAKAEEAGRRTAKAAETGAKKEAEIASPSKRWLALGHNMALSMAMGQLQGARAVEEASRDNVRGAMKAASDEFKKRRRSDGSWATVAEQGRAHEQRGMAMARDGQMVAMRSRPLHVTLELDGRVLDERIIETGIGGLHNALQRNPLQRRRG